MQAADLLAILDAEPIDPAALAVLSNGQRRRAQAGIDALIDYLDAIEPDPDLEDDAGAEPYMGRCETGADAQRCFEVPGLDECEPDGDSEPSFGAPERHPSLWNFGHDLLADQTRWADGCDRDLEAVNEDGGDILDERHDAEDMAYA